MQEKETQEFENDISNWDWYTELEKRVPAISAAQLMEKTFEPREYVVRGFLPAGLSIFSGAPKIGKSWLMLDLCLHVATGEPFLGMPVTKGTAWYISLEDPWDRVRQRLGCITDDEPDNLFFTTEEDQIGTMADTLEKHINNFLDQHPDTRLIVIDTLQLARGNSKDPAYGHDYTDVHNIKRIADNRKVAIMMVHHVRKAGDADPLNRISGSNGISGAADTLFVLDKSARMEDVARLTCTGRDVQQRELELRFDKTACVWTKVSDSMDAETQLPPEMCILLNFMKEVRHFSDTNAVLAKYLNLRSQVAHTAKSWKQMMNRWAFILQDHGLTFRDFRSNGQRFVELTYTPIVSEGTQVTQTLGA